MNATFGHDSLPEMEKLVECPYNKAHLVVKHRMPKHLVKCRKTHGTKGTKECRFNISHILPLDEIMSHEASCPDRVLIESFMNHRADQQETSCSSSGCSSKTESVAGDWDNISVSSYKPPKRY